MNSTASPLALWEQTLEDLRGQIDAESFDAWLIPIRFERCEDGRLTLAVPSTFHRNWMTWNYQDQIELAFSQRFDQPASVEFVVDPRLEDPQLDEDAPSSDMPANGASPSAQFSSEPLIEQGDLTPVTLNPLCTFESYVVGESNRFANAAAQAVADPSSRVYNPLFLYGGSGLGKTHLMHAIGRQMLSYGSHFNVLYVSSESFMNSFIEAIQRKELTHFRNRFRNVDLLLIDDVQFFAGAERSQIEFFHTFNTLFESGRKIVISSDRNPTELHELEERLRSRFEAGLIVDIQPPELETRVAILLRKAESARLDLTPEVAIYIAERITTNVRKLEGALQKLAAHHSITQEPLTIPTVRDILGTLFPGDEPLKITVDKIQQTVCVYFDISIKDLTGSSRTRKFTFPRQVAVYLSRELTSLSFPEIGRKFARDHTSIMHAYRKIQREMRSDLGQQNLVKYLTKLVKEEPLPRVRP